MSSPKIFTPIKIGPYNLGHRIVLAPLTRFRANSKHVHGPLAVEYYNQRASVSLISVPNNCKLISSLQTPGTLLITEGTFIAQEAGGFRNVPGIWNEDQMTAWKQVRFMQYQCAMQEILKGFKGHRFSSCKEVLYILATLGSGKSRRT